MDKWFYELKKCLQEYYLPNEPPVVGWLCGSNSPAVWRQMDEAGSGQMVILGNKEPTLQEWQAAGVAHRLHEKKSITLPELTGFIILYGGFVYRPWGHIVPQSEDALKLGFPGSLKSWENNKPS